MSTRYKANLGKRLKHLRERSGFSQDQLSRGICTGAFLSMVEKGRYWPSFPLLLAISRRLKVPTAKLLP